MHLIHMEGTMPSFRVTYMRTSYMELDVAADDCREAAMKFEALAASKPLVCEHGDTLALPRFHLVDVFAVDTQPLVHGAPNDPAEMAAGKKIFDEGIPARNVPACTACHGEQAQGAGAIPRLAGQHRSYLERQLDAFLSNARANEIMHENSKNLISQKISQVAAFLSAL
jgi:cytochrome c553